MATKAKYRSNKPEGAPRWTYIAAALVSIVGAAWAIASHFIPKTEPDAKPASAVAAPAPVTRQSAEATGGTAINAAGAARVSVDHEMPPSSTAGAQAGVAASQGARAGRGGTAVNAADAADVGVRRP